MTGVLRQVRFPLKLKLLALIIVLVASSLVVFVLIALGIFRADKAAYIYESLLNKATSEQIILAQKLARIDPQASFEYRGQQIYYGAQNPEEVLKKALSEDSSYSNKIIIPAQNELLQWTEQKPLLLSGVEKAFLREPLSKSFYEGVREIEIGKEKILYAYSYNPEKNFIFVATLPQNKAFEVATYLINKSVYYGLFILGLSMFISVILARPLTAQLETLFEMTQELAKGHFDQRVKINGSDEVGALSDSINDMASKIVIYMNEMKEKARLENEVEVAQLVQASFFPAAHSTQDIYGHFEPATECGGDWWGYHDFNEWRIFFIADATGHGVPAALLTATMNCCKSSLSFILESKPELISAPDEILRYMNLAVCGAGKEIQVTCFVASFNKTTKEFIYSNSSHNPPLYFSQSADGLKKEHFQPLNGANGPRLGQSPESRFLKESMSLNNCDTILFYTDGLTEAENAEGSRWGERRLIKSLLIHGQGTPQEVVDGVLGEFKEFTESRPKSDDITVVAMKVLS
jgi:phosphoserine phosphatase RsbU/P